MSEIKDIKKFREQHGLTQRKLAERCGVTLRTVQNWEMGKTIPESAMRLMQHINGEGKTVAPNMKEEKDDTAGIPYFAYETFECGKTNGFSSALTRENADGFMKIPGLNYDANTFSVQAHGDSMVNTEDPRHNIPSGAWVTLRKTMLSTIRWGEVYALATADGFIIKKLMPSEREGWVKCVSFNQKDYPPFELSVNEIFDYAIVTSVVSVNIW